MEKRTTRRVKRRITCEFSHDGGAYKGIVLDLDPGGLFIRTNATIAPGSQIAIHLAASAVAPEMTLRVQVARRRLVPANLTSILNRGLGVRILEAPREYGQLIGVGKLEAPIQVESDIANPTKPTEPDSAASTPAQPKSAPAAVPEPVAMPSTPADTEPVSPPIPRSKPWETPSRAHGFKIDIPSPESRPTPIALLIGDDELDVFSDVLVELGVDVIRREPTDPELKVLDAPRLIVVSARMALAHTIRLRGAATVSIVVFDEASKTTRKMLERQGFRYLLQQPVHTDALRLLVRYALFDQPDRRSRTRLPFGYEVSWRVGWREGWRRQQGSILEISMGGCRLLAAESLPLDTRIHVKIPGTVAGGRTLKLRATVIRCSPHRSGDQREYTALAVVFDDLTPRLQQRLALVCDLLSEGPPVLPATAPTVSERTDSSENDEASVTEEAPEEGNCGEETANSEPRDEDSASDERSAEPTNRRQFSRSRLDREIVEIDTDQRVVQALLGRDLSMGGIRIDAQSALEAGDKLQLAIFDTSRKQPLVLHAVVARDDGLAGMGLHFVDVSSDAEAELAEMLAALPALESTGPSGCHTVVPAGILARDETSASMDTEHPAHTDPPDSN